MSRCTSAAMSTLAYGVRMTFVPAVALPSAFSQVPAALLAGLLVAPVQSAGSPPTWYGFFMVDTLASRAGSTAQVRSAPGLSAPAVSRVPRRPFGVTLLASSLLVSAGQT